MWNKINKMSSLSDPSLEKEESRKKCRNSDCESPRTKVSGTGTQCNGCIYKRRKLKQQKKLEQTAKQFLEFETNMFNQLVQLEQNLSSKIALMHHQNDDVKSPSHVYDLLSLLEKVILGISNQISDLPNHIKKLEHRFEEILPSRGAKLINMVFIISHLLGDSIFEEYVVYRMKRISGTAPQDSMESLTGIRCNATIFVKDIQDGLEVLFSQGGLSPNDPRRKHLSSQFNDCLKSLSLESF